MLAAGALCLAWVTTGAPLGVAVSTAAAETPTGVHEELRRATNEYAYGNYEEAAQHLRALLYPMRLVSDEQVIEARKYLALTYYLLDQLDEVGEEFAKLLYLDPDYDLDPFTVAPPVIEIFESIRKQLAPELDVIRQRKSDAQLDAAQLRGLRRTVTTRVVEHSELGTLMPFGIGQFQNGQVAWGVLFGGAQLALVGANVAAYLTARRHSVYGAEDVEARQLVQRLTVAQYTSAALFGVAWSVGVFHARLHFIPSVMSPPVVHDDPISTALRSSPTMVLSGQF